MMRNRLKTNEDRTEFIVHLKHKKFNADLEFEIGNIKVKSSTNCGNLGVMFGSNMTMEVQI